MQKIPHSDLRVERCKERGKKVLLFFLLNFFADPTEKKKENSLMEGL